MVCGIWGVHTIHVSTIYVKREPIRVDDGATMVALLMKKFCRKLMDMFFPQHIHCAEWYSLPTNHVQT